MSILGSPIVAGLGSPESMIDYVNAQLVSGNTQISVSFRPRAIYGDAYFGIYRNALFVQNVYAPEGQETTVYINVFAGDTGASILVLRLGGFSDSSYSIERVARVFETANAQRATVRWNWPSEILGTPDNADLTAWSLSGVRYRHAFHPPHQATRGIFNVDVTVSGGNATITIKSGNEKLAEGTGAVGGSITLTQQNTSGISGSVTAAAGITAATDVKLYIRWPKQMKVKRGTVDPPTAVVQTSRFNNSDKARWSEPSDLAADTYFYRVQPVSDTGDNGTESISASVTIVATPKPPTNLAYSSGAAANTIVSFTASPTVGATYRAYVQNPGGAPPNMDVPDATAAAGATTIALPAITGFPGTARVWVRAVLATVEENNSSILEIEYDAAGVRVAPRPNDPSLISGSLRVTLGRTLGVVCVYNSVDEKTIATQVKLFSRAPGGSYDFTVIDDTQTLGAGPTGMKRATFSKAYLADGFRYITAKAYNAGGQAGAGRAVEFLTYVSAADMAAPSIEVFQSRG